MESRRFPGTLLEIAFPLAEGDGQHSVQEHDTVVANQRTNPTLSRRSALALAGGAAAGVAVPGLGRAAAQGAEEAAQQQVYFGWVLGSADIIAVAIDISAEDDKGERTLLAYVCDGLGMPDGLARWYKSVGTLEEQLSLTPPGGDEQLVISSIHPHSVTGAFTGKDGAARKFAAFRATDGAGIYDVILAEDLRYTGKSTNGSVLDAQATDEGRVTGTITTADGAEVSFSLSVLARLEEEALTEAGLSPAFLEFADVSIVPDSYVAVISPGGAFWLGRSGDIRKGEVGNNIIGLDMME